MRPVAALALLAACAGPRATGVGRLADRADEGKRIHAVEFEGVKAFSGSKIVDKMGLRGPEGIVKKDYTTFERLTARLDLRRIAAFYAANGYFSAVVPAYKVVPLEDGSLDVVFVVDEGQPTRVTQISLDGAPNLPEVPETGEAHLRKLFGIEPGAVFVHADYLLGRDIIKAELVAHGFVYAQVSGDVIVDRDKRTAEIALAVDAGTRFKFGKLKIAGTSKVPETSIRARVPWQEGDVFGPAQLTRLQGRLLRLGLFGQVRITYEAETDHADLLDVTVTLGDGVRHDLRIGAGVRVSGIEQTTVGLAFRLDPHLRASYTLYRVFDPLSTLSLDLRPGYAIFVNTEGNDGFTGSLSATLGREDLFTPYLHGAFTLAYDADILEAYQATGPRVRLGLDDLLLDEKLRLALSWQLRGVTIAPTNDDPVLGAALAVPSPYRLGTFSETVAWDRRDALLSPTRGTYLSLDVAEGGGFAGGAIDYLRFDAQARGYLRALPRLILAARARFGFLAPGDDAAQPVTERFFGGGRDMRGFGYRKLAPEAPDSGGKLYPIGGNAMVEGSAEARWVAYRWSRDVAFELALFLDTGDVVPSLGELSLAPDRLHWAAGFGVYVLTPIGPIGLDVGFRLNRRDAPNPQAGSYGAVNFTLGEPF